MNNKISIAVSVLGHINRFEWLLEKATEFKVHQIFPLRLDRTKYIRLHKERLRPIMRSYSAKYRTEMPILHDTCSLEYLFKLNCIPDTRFIAHYSQENKDMLCQSSKDCMLLIGPEDGFTDDEIKFSIQNNCKLVTLGDVKLRTEAAGMAGMCILNGIWKTIPNSVLSN